MGNTPSWITIKQGERVKVVSVDYCPAELSGNNNAVYVYALYKKLYRWGIPFKMVLPGSVDDFGTGPELVTDMQGGGFNPANAVGPFKFVMGDAEVSGLGLPLNRHVRYVITFRLLTDYQT